MLLHSKSSSLLPAAGVATASIVAHLQGLWAAVMQLLLALDHPRPSLVALQDLICMVLCLFLVRQVCLACPSMFRTSKGLSLVL
jgi:hypothetical protein